MFFYIKNSKKEEEKKKPELRANGLGQRAGQSDGTGYAFMDVQALQGFTWERFPPHPSDVSFQEELHEEQEGQTK